MCLLNSLKQNEVHVWCIDVGCHTNHMPNLWPILSEDEAKRAKRFKFDVDRNLYVVAHAAMREILASYLDQTPAALLIARTDKGKPYIKASNLHFNLSHSHQFAMLAVSNASPVGVDVEHVRNAPQNIVELAQRFFADKEYHQLKALPVGHQKEAFMKTWTRKEAFVKAIGAGLSFPLQAVLVNVPPIPASITLLESEYAVSSAWSLSELTVPSGYLATLAVQHAQPSIKYYHY